MTKSRRVDQNEESRNPEHDGDHAFDQEDPTPALIATDSIHLRNSCSCHARESTGERAEAVEPRDAGGEVARKVPLATQEHCSRKETCFEDSKQDAESQQAGVVGYYAVHGHDDSPDGHEHTHV